ncbi:MAG: glycine cleavage system aminomethyltransferase GcvT [Azospirillaceae bacterium]|nr:glycine cleavage system aminomethyltransferase GcvT [Azospirillaceae bacterium]
MTTALPQDSVSPPDELRTTPLHALHRELGGRLVPFAGYEMPVQYPAGILKEHLHTRAQAGLFDVSHMGQVRLSGPDVRAALERLVPGDLQALGERRVRYTLLLNEQGGIRDDLMVTNGGDHLFLVINAGCKRDDIAHLRAALPSSISVEPLEDLALLALQGPAAALVLGRHIPGIAALRFMTVTDAVIGGIAVAVTRSGYTGEDGFEISVAADHAEAIARLLLAEPEVAPIGLGARDSLRLEAGLCLYGHDIDETTTPVEAGLTWTISARRRAAGGFPGDALIQRQWAEGPERVRVGLRPVGRAPARDGTEIQDPAGQRVGIVTSGGFGPTVNGPVAMGYVAAAQATPDTALTLIVRGKPLAATVAKLPFVPARFFRGGTL